MIGADRINDLDWVYKDFGCHFRSFLAILLRELFSSFISLHIIFKDFESWIFQKNSGCNHPFGYTLVSTQLRTVSRQSLLDKDLAQRLFVCIKPSGCPSCHFRIPRNQEKNFQRKLEWALLFVLIFTFKVSRMSSRVPRTAHCSKIKCLLYFNVSCTLYGLFSFLIIAPVCDIWVRRRKGWSRADGKGREGARLTPLCHLRQRLEAEPCNLCESCWR